MTDLCPACGKREQDPYTAEGWCSPCTVDKLAESFIEQDRGRVQRSVVEWTQRTAGPKAPHSRLKQQRSRLMRTVKPREPMRRGFDPLMMGAEALNILSQFRSAIRDQVAYEQVTETIRRLAWGPDSTDAIAPLVQLHVVHRRTHHEIPGQLRLWDEDEMEVAA